MLPLVWLIRKRLRCKINRTEISQKDYRWSSQGISPWTLQVLLWFAVLCCCSAMAMPVVHLVSYGTDLGHSAAHAARLMSVLMGVAFFSGLLSACCQIELGP